MSLKYSDSLKQKLQIMREEIDRLNTERKIYPSPAEIETTLAELQRKHEKAEGRHEQKRLEQQYLYWKSFLRYHDPNIFPDLCQKQSKK